MLLLLVEDDSRLSEYLCEALGREGYNVEVCRSVEETEAFMATESIPGVVVLDRMLGRADGASLIPQLKAKYPQCGVLVLSSLDMASEKARLIDGGADEYVSKPFALEELTARLRLVVRRAKSETVEISVRAVGNLTINLKTQNGTVGNQKIDLTRKEFQILSLLMDQPGRVYNRFQILDRVWEMDRIVESNVVETAIKTLRRKLEEAGCSARIESKRNVGYWIEA